MHAINITMYTQDTTQIEAVKTFMKSLNIKFEITNVKFYELTAKQQHVLDNQINLNKILYKDAETIYTDLKNSYKL
ncbi:hypothetical protein [Flavobacterium sp. Root420]|uniref:hypothetical protein n=1 Tax=Flavobacterium sp. Root420 TaxID=1736533 RepID=UPI000701412F|nr:hypothetical protein [Flavobacterium sp. Root420]KQW99342.1 hypothetical protein ASC72_09685 [Flavobacterium sp. Root420]